MRVSMSAIGSVESFAFSSRVPHVGRRLPLTAAPVGYQLDFVTPGSCPSQGRSRKQMRHSPNLRM